MESLPPIPTPAGQRWREFRIRILPFFVFVVAALGLVSLWKGYVQPSGVIGAVETQVANVISITDGQLVELNVEQFQSVTKDQVLGTASQMDPELISASLAAITADLQILRARMTVEDRRNDQSYQQIRLDILNQEVLLATAGVNYYQASNEFYRVSQLYNSEPRMESGTVYDLAKAKHDSLLADIRERTRLIKEMKDSLPNLMAKNSAEAQGKDPISLAVQAKELEFQLAVQPSKLKAPMDGVVTLVSKRPGEKVLKGDVIMTISSPKAERVVGYIRQPINYVPTTNDTVFVRSRTQKRTVGVGQIVRVGANLVPIDPLLLSTESNRHEIGLPIMVSLPAGMKVTPGEYVDMSIRPKNKG